MKLTTKLSSIILFYSFSAMGMAHYKETKDPGKNGQNFVQEIEMQDTALSKQNTGIKSVVFDTNSVECKNWVNAHLKFCGEDEYRVAKTLLDTTEYVSFIEFSNKIMVLLKEVNEEIKKTKFVALIEKNKSSEWLFKLFRTQLSQDFDVIQDEYLQKNKPNLEQYLKDHPDVLDVLKLDDAIYSGVQMTSFIKEVNDTFKRLGKKGTIHIVAPFATSYGKERIESQKAENSISIRLYEPISKIHSISENLSSEDLKVADRMYPRAGSSKTNRKYRWREMTNFFLQHKIPNGLSSLTDFTRFGRVRCKDGSMVKGFIHQTKIEFGCVPFILPPYKKRVSKNDYRSLETRCRDKIRNPKHESFCKKVLEDRKDLLQKM